MWIVADSQEVVISTAFSFSKITGQNLVSILLHGCIGIPKISRNIPRKCAFYVCDIPD